MLNLRYHVISLVAVFLALGIGVIMGVTVINRGIVDQLQKRLDGVEASDRKTRRENDRLSTQLRTWDRFVEQARPDLLAGQLARAPQVGGRGPPPSPPPPAERDVHRDPVEPGVERRLPVERAEPAEGPDEAVLEGFGGVVPAAQDAKQGVEQAV